MPPDPLEHPIAALTDHPVLSTEREAALIEVLLAGAHARAALPWAPPSAVAATQQQAALGEAARATLVRHNLRLVVSIAKRYLRVAGQHLTLEDLVSFGSVGLIQGIDRFDPQKGGKLSTYATWWIRQAIGRGIAVEGRVIALPVHIHERLGKQWRARSRLSHELGDTLPDTRFDPEATTLDQTLRADLAGAMARLLTEREQRFLRAYVGFDTGQKATLEEVGAAEGLTRERARQVIASALAKLRTDPAIQAYGALFAV